MTEYVLTLAGLGKRVRELRYAAGYQGEGWMLKDFCDQVGIPKTTLLAIERGERELGSLNLVRLCVALEVSADEVLGLARQVAE